MRGGMIGAALYEGLARTPEEAIAKAQSGEIEFDAAQNHGAMAGGVGSITASMPVMVVEDSSNGNISTHFLMEGLGQDAGLGRLRRCGAGSAALVPRQFRAAARPGHPRARRHRPRAR